MWFQRIPPKVMRHTSGTQGWFVYDLASNWIGLYIRLQLYQEVDAVSCGTDKCYGSTRDWPFTDSLQSCECLR